MQQHLEQLHKFHQDSLLWVVLIGSEGRVLASLNTDRDADDKVWQRIHAVHLQMTTIVRDLGLDQLHMMQIEGDPEKQDEPRVFIFTVPCHQWLLAVSVNKKVRTGLLRLDVLRTIEKMCGGPVPMSA